ncbi:hypothetical protein A6X21_04725 [Planctopirus hydrillae]|uniref:Uncharacterized protein n=1 Tax=Planctopirus hydrillae TaxID=1841610 RepID=A0A1C3ENY4_9PLAN|nr:hypothetical protein A6X21_04725 [Planctopirus hydrillae]
MAGGECANPFDGHHPGGWHRTMAESLEQFAGITRHGFDGNRPCPNGSGLAGTLNCRGWPALLADQVGTFRHGLRNVPKQAPKSGAQSGAVCPRTGALRSHQNNSRIGRRLGEKRKNP